MTKFGSLLPRRASEIEPLFQFYRVGWSFAASGRRCPEHLDCPELDPIRVLYLEYDLHSGYSAFIHRSQRSGS
jgi:hypothetical protein